VSSGGDAVVGKTNAPVDSNAAGVSGYGNGNGTYGVYAFGVGGTGTGVYGIGGDGMSGTGNGVYGFSPGGDGVHGDTNGAANSFAAGVNGTGVNAGTFGVFGSSAAGYGVQGQTGTTPNTGTIGVIGFGNGTNTYGVYGDGYSGTGTGVFGTSPGGYGVNGKSSSGNGVYGQSTTGYGVLGYTSGGSASLSGISTNKDIPAFAGGNSIVGGLAATFSGTVFVNGKLIVADPSYKSGMLKHADGSYRLVYCVESPESWIEDFGKGQLTNGKAVVTFDADFAALVQTQDYLVFLTETGGHLHLAVTAQTASGFTVASESGSGSGGCNWRVVAKPKTEKKLSRLEKFSPPEIKLPDPATLSTPNAPTPQKRPQKPAALPIPKRLSAPQGNDKALAAPAAAPTARPAPPAPQGSGTAPSGGNSPAVQPIPQPRSG
jgi:hypothetical protein